MERRRAIIIAPLIAAVPLGIIVWSHTHAWPERFAAYTDTYRAQGPTVVFNDLTPGNRLVAAWDADGTEMRRVHASPVYLLFQPRMHTRWIVVEARLRSSQPVAAPVRIGYRTGNGPEFNVTQPAERVGDVYRARLPFDAMVAELTDARRIVFELPHDGGITWDVHAIRIRYEE